MLSSIQIGKSTLQIQEEKPNVPHTQFMPLQYCSKQKCHSALLVIWVKKASSPLLGRKTKKDNVLLT